tara:strand:- start:359 stop:673 length:315 start_codon:yes stop_codon:yes gene_type:complete
MGDVKEQPRCGVDEYGAKYWRINGKLHRENGPAIERANGTKEWYLHDKLHREDGPAHEHASGFKAWWLHGQLTHPEQIVDLHLSRGTFCYYNEETDMLHFDETK